MSSSGISATGRVELTRVLSGRRFVTPESAAADLSLSADVAARRLARWAREGWLRRVRRGLYLGVPVDAEAPNTWSEDPLVVAVEVWPCYFTGWTAASHWALTDQIFRTTVLKTTSRVRASRVRLLEHDYLVSTVSTDAMRWGLRSEWRDGSRLRFADPARAVLDILDRPKVAGGMRHGAEVIHAYLDSYDPTTLIDYADRWGNRTVYKRLGYCVEALGLRIPGIVEACREHMSTGISALDPDGAEGGRVLTRWNLRINATISQQEPS